MEVDSAGQPDEEPGFLPHLSVPADTAVMYATAPGRYMHTARPILFSKARGSDFYMCLTEENVAFILHTIRKLHGFTRKHMMILWRYVDRTNTQKNN